MSLNGYRMDDIQRFIEERERSKKFQFQRLIEVTERGLKENDAYYRVLIQRIESRSKEIQDIVKKVKDDYVRVCSLLKKEHARLLQQHKSTLSGKFKKFNSDFQMFRLTVASAPCVSITDIEQQLSDFDIEIPVLPHLSDYTFVIENTDPIGEISDAFGLLGSGRNKKESNKKQDKDVNTQSDRSDASTQTEGNELMPTEYDPCSNRKIASSQEQTTHEENDNNSDLWSSSKEQRCETVAKPGNNISRYCLKAVSNFKHPNAYTALCATVNGAWIAFDRMKKVVLVNINGDVTRSVVAQDCVEDICISNIPGLLWVACSDKRIVEYHEDDTTGVVLKVPNRPKCLCITADGHIVVGSLGDTERSGGSMSVYDTKGEKLNIIKGPRVRPLQMTSHRLDTTIAVVHGGNSIRPCVTVYNGHLEPQYTYHGERPSFHPSNLCFHGDGNLFVCDSSSSSILVLDDLGHCLTTVSVVSPRQPLVLSIDVDTIWVGYNDSIININQIVYNSLHNTPNTAC